MATMDEIEETVMYIEEEWRKENNSSLPLILLHCVSLYPTPKEEANLSAITSLKERFPYPVGYSDHTIGIVAAVAAVSLGAVIIEKHFTLDKNLPGPDHFISSDPQEMRELVERCKEAAVMTWRTKIKGGSLKERSQISLVRKSIVAKREIKEGELLDESNLGIKRPGYGILPKYLPKLIGKRAKVNIKEDELINWDKVM
jgi:N,N'-diacetyllegionaminate synthase